MAYFTLKKPGVDPEAESAESSVSREEVIRKILSHPIRVRIIGILGDGRAMTQRELGKDLYMSNAAIHYHLKQLISASLVKLKGTRPGPNGIVEKLYVTDPDELQSVLGMTEEGIDMEFYLNYTVSWMHERHREGAELLREDKFSSAFMTGSFVARAPQAEIIKLKRDVEKLYENFYKKYGQSEGDEDHVPCAVTFSVLPTRDKAGEASHNILEFEPGEKASKHERSKKRRVK